jgi:hypothetical protein
VPPPPVAACRASVPPRKLITRGVDGDHIPTPVAGVAADAYYIRAGKLCRSRWNEETGAGEEKCSDLHGCSNEDAKEITLLIGDSSEHFYGLAAAKKELFFIKLKDARTVDATCFMQSQEQLLPNPAEGKLGPNLVLGPDGTLYNSSEQRNLLAIVPKAFATTETLTLSQAVVKDNAIATAFRAPGTISTAPGLNLPEDSNIILVAREKITFGQGLKAPAGASLRARVGF